MRFSSTHQPTKAQLKQGYQGRSLKASVQSRMRSFTVEELFTEEDILELQKNYFPEYENLEKFKKATAQELLGYKFAKLAR